MEQNDNLLTIAEAAHYMGLKRHTVAKMVNQGKIEIYRLGQRGGRPTLITREACDHNRAVVSGAVQGDFLSRRQAIELLGISSAWFDQEVSNGNITPVEQGGNARKKYFLDDLLRYKADFVTTPPEGSYSPAEARAYLGISRQALNRAVLDGRIEYSLNPAHSANTKYFFRKAALDDYKLRPKRRGRPKGGKNRPK